MEITKILGNRLVQKVLSFFLVHQDEEFYLRQFASILKEDPSNLSKVVKKISNEGLLLAAVKGREKYFRLNKSHPLYLEIRNLLQKTVGLEAQLAAELKNISGLKRAFVYGSLAKGDFSSASDIDLFLIGKIDENELLLKIKKIEQGFGREINYLLLAPEEFKKRIRTDSFVKAVLNGPKINLL